VKICRCDNLSASSNVRGKLSRDNTSRPRLSTPQSDSTLYPEGCAPVQTNIFPGCFKSIFVCNTSRSRQNKPNCFRYICGEVAWKWPRKALSQLVRNAYELCFCSNVRAQDKIWAPKICCSSHSRTLARWLKGTHKSMPSAVPTVWRQPRNHLNDCYFCMKITGFSRFSMHQIEYSSTPFALRAAPRDD
jgi:hypothetical protein